MDETVINMLIKLGVDAFRLNFSHGSHREKNTIIKLIRALTRKHDLYIPIIGDLQGPVIRMRVERDVPIVEGKTYVFSYEKGLINVPSRDFYNIVDVGDILLVDDGKLIFKVIDRGDEEINVNALRGGVLHDRKKIFIKGKNVRESPLTPKDIEDLKFCINHGIEYIALSMASSPEDIKVLRDEIGEYGGDQWIIAKIENPLGVKNARKICEVSEGIMIARGDLGQYFPLEKIPEIQRKIIYEGNRRGRITIIATQILESMLENDTPTRAEVTDIFNSVSEKVDAILLTSETAIGKNPVLTVEWAIRILSEADKRYSDEILYYRNDFIEDIFDKFARGVIYLSHLINGNIIGFTKRGNTARRLARYRPKKRIYIAVQDRILANKLNILYSINPILINKRDDYWKVLEYAKEYLIRRKIIGKGDILIYTIGVRPETTDMIKVETI